MSSLKAPASRFGSCKSAFIFATALTSLLSGPQANAATRVWKLGGNGNWFNGLNWVTGTPVAGDIVSLGDAIPAPVFPATTNNVNNLTADIVLGGILFTNSAQNSPPVTNAFSASGNRITLGGDITSTASTTAITDTLSFAMILDGNRTVTTGAGHNLTLSGILSETGGSFGITKADPGDLTLSGVNTYTGATTVNGGRLILSNLSAIKDSSSVTVASGATLQPNLTGTFLNTAAVSLTGPGFNTGPTAFAGALHFSTNGTTAWNAPITLEAGTNRVTSIGTFANLTLGAAIGGDGSLELSSRGGTAANHTAVWTLGVANNYTGSNTRIVTNDGLKDITVKLGVTNALPTTTSLNLSVNLSQASLTTSAALDLNGFSQTLAGLTDIGGAVGSATSTGGKRIINSSATLATLTLNIDSGTNTYGTTGTNITAGTIGGTTSAAVAADNLNLTKTGSGTLVLTATNTYLDTTVSGGTLQIGAGSGTGTLGSGPVLNNAELSFNRNNNTTVNNVISGTGSVTKLGVGTLLVGGNNTYSGGTSISAGTLRLSGDLGGKLGSGAVTVAGSGGTNFLIWSPTPTPVTLNNNIVLNGATGVNNRAALNHDGGNGKVTLNGSLTLNATSDIGIGGGSGNDMEITGVISGPGGMIVDESNIVNFNASLILSGANTYAGSTTIVGGILRLGATNVIPNGSPIIIGTSSGNAAATLNAATAGTETALSLDVTDVAIINLGVGAKLIFTNGGTATWAGSLDITGDFVSGSSLKFGNSSSGLTLAQLAAITLNGVSGSYTLDSNGFLVSGGAPTGFAGWQAANSTAGGLNADHDNDGVSNGIEFFLVGPVSSTGFTTLPAAVPGGGTFSITWIKSAGYTGAYNTDFVVETSATLAGPWTTETSGVNVALSGNNVTFTFPLPLGTKNFARLKVTGP